MMKPSLIGLLLVAALAVPAPEVRARAPIVHPMEVPAHGVVGVTDAHLDPEYWVARLESPDELLATAAQVEQQNARLFALDDTMYDLHGFPERLTGSQVREWLEISGIPADTRRWDVAGQPVPATVFERLRDNVAMEDIATTQPTRFGLVVRRTAMRSLPTEQRMFSRAGETDIDRLQESALFPGTPVVIAHQSRDGAWLFVVSPRYAAWVQVTDIAEGDREEVLAYAGRQAYRVVTGATARTVFTREEPRVSELQLDMGLRVPLADVPPDRPINGQHPIASYPVQLPVRDADGSLAFVAALLPRSADSEADYLPLTQANLIRQGFKFLGERYGWGHAYNARDCSGFVSEIYRSMGVQVPRNTSAQAISPALPHRRFTDRDDRAARMAAVSQLQVGDLVYIPGHVMMVIGDIDGEPYVIHDTNGGSYLGADGELRGMALNGVVVTPLLPMMSSTTASYVDRMTSIVRPAGPLTPAR